MSNDVEEAQKTEDFRRQCEAREVMRWNKYRRREYYEGVKKNRGEAAMLELVAEVKIQAKKARIYYAEQER